MSLPLFWKLLNEIPIHYILCGKKYAPKTQIFSRNIPSYIPDSLKAFDFWDNKNQHHEFIFGSLRNKIFKKWNVFQLLTLKNTGFWWFLDSCYSTSPPRQSSQTQLCLFSPLGFFLTEFTLQTLPLGNGSGLFDWTILLDSYGSGK